MPAVTDATVVAQAYDTSGNGGRKLVQLKDGSFVSAVKNSTSQFIYITMDNWNTKNTIFSYTAYPNFQDIAICTDGNNIFSLYAVNGTTVSFGSYKVDGTLINGYTVDSSQTALGNVSLVINEAKTELHATWASKNSTYPNSFNIRYAKGTINGDGTVSWSAVEQWTKINVLSQYYQNPAIVVINNYPYVFVESYDTSVGTSAFKMSLLTNKPGFPNEYPNSLKGSISVSMSGYAQSSPSAIYVPQSINGLANGLIANAWHGTDSTSGGVNYIRFSKSTDGGVNWSMMQKLVPGTNASLTANKSGKLFITYEDADVTKRIESTDNGDTWSSAITVGTGTNPSSLFDLTMNMTAPLTIRKGTSSVLFSGAWTVTTISVTPGDIGQIQDKNNILSYSITTDGEMSTITEKINGIVVNTRTANSGDALALGLTQAQWDAIRFGRYADATGGKNTLTVEMDTEKWTYTFDKHLATDADILSATKAVKDTNEVYLPSVKKQLADAINAKGGSVSANADLLTMINGLSITPSKKWASGTLTSSSSTLNFENYSGSTNSSYYVPLDMSVLGFIPSTIVLLTTSKSSALTTWTHDDYYVNGSFGANVFKDGGIRLRSNYTNGIVNIPVGNGSTQYTWTAYE